MVIPSRRDTMIKNKMQQNKKNNSINECIKQFPDCPTEKNWQDCKLCPFYKK